MHTAESLLPIALQQRKPSGHVNNTVMFRWFESSRIALLEEFGISSALGRLKLGPILAATSCDYRRQLHYPDDVTLTSRVTRLGRSSMTVQHACFSQQQDALAADGDSVVVIFDFAKQRPVRIPDEVRNLIFQFQPELAAKESEQDQ